VTLVEDLARRIAEARACWLDVERLADETADDELDGRVQIARLSILDAADRAQQLRDLDADLEVATA
jgi:hypothetical protein